MKSLSMIFSYLLFDLRLRLVAYTVPSGLGLTLMFMAVMAVALLAAARSSDTISALIIRARDGGSWWRAW